MPQLVQQKEYELIKWEEMEAEGIKEKGNSKVSIFSGWNSEKSVGLRHTFESSLYMKSKALAVEALAQRDYADWEEFQ